MGTTNNGGPIVPELGFTPFFGPTLLLVPFLCFWILWPNWGATLYGEVRGASDFKRVMSGMMWGLWVTVGVALAFVFLSAKFFGWEFFNAANLNYWAAVYGFGEATIPVWSYPPLLASFYFHSELISALIILAFGAWFLGWAGTLFLSSTRVIFAAAFDRILPEKVADVSERRHVPVWALDPDAGPGPHRERVLRLHLHVPNLDPGCHARDRGDVPRLGDRGDDPARGGRSDCTRAPRWLGTRSPASRSSR